MIRFIVAYGSQDSIIEQVDVAATYSMVLVSSVGAKSLRHCMYFTGRTFEEQSSFAKWDEG